MGGKKGGKRWVNHRIRAPECTCSWSVFLYFCSLAFWVITTQARYGVTNKQSGFVVFQNFRQKKVMMGWMTVLELVVAISELGNKWHARSTWIDQCKKKE